MNERTVREIMFAAQPRTPDLPWGEAHAAFTRMSAQFDELKILTLALYSEVDCRIEHGAESGGHLEYVRTCLRAMRAAATEEVRS
jgi:hypothetical protein